MSKQANPLDDQVIIAFARKVVARQNGLKRHQKPVKQGSNRFQTKKSAAA
jgi:hypothetical protein